MTTTREAGPRPLTQALIGAVLLALAAALWIDAAGLPPRTRVGPRRRVVVDQVPVVGLGVSGGGAVGGRPPAVLALAHPDDLVADRETQPLRQRRPHIEP